MSTTHTISGVAWDHRRCWGPLEASTEDYRAKTGRSVRWDRRSLFSFGEGGLEQFADAYDLVIFDHPFVGEIARDGLFFDLNTFLTDADRAHFAADAIGGAWQSYAYDGGVWALPIDVAAQTAAWRQDLLERAGLPVPTTMDELFAFVPLANAKGLAMAWPAKPTDLLCTMMTLGASLGLPVGAGSGPFLSVADAIDIVELLRRLLAISHPSSRTWNPIQCFDAMSAGDEIGYVPFAFNYVNYATAPRPIRFGAPPRAVGERPVHALLGGAGIGVSRKSKDPRGAFEYAMYLCSPEMQSGLYVREGGQPGSRAAWQSAESNAVTANFFADTLSTMDASFLRPTHPGFIALFHEATLRLAAVVHDGAPAPAFVSWLNEGYDRLRPKETMETT